MKNYMFHFKDGTAETGHGFSGLNAWHNLGYSTYSWSMLQYAQEI